MACVCHIPKICILCINGNPLWYSCLENPMDRGACVGYTPQGSKESDTTERLHFKIYFTHTYIYILSLSVLMPDINYSQYSFLILQ